MLDFLISWIEDKSVNLKLVPISVLSSLLFDEEFQVKFYDHFFNIFEKNQDKIIQFRYLGVIERLVLTNYHYFHNWKNFDRLISSNKLLTYGPMVMASIKILLCIVQSAVNVQGNEESCNLKITGQNLEDLIQLLNI